MLVWFPRRTTKEGLDHVPHAGPSPDVRLISALTLLAVLALVGSASAATRTVGFDDVMPDTRVSTEYETSHGVTFPDDPVPMVKTFPGKAHSGDRVGVSTCEGLPGCGEAFPPPRLRGVLTNSASSVSAYVGYWDNPLFPNPGDTMQARIRAYNSDDELVSESGYVTVTSGATLTQQVTATAPAGQRIAYFDVTADAGDGGGETLAIDDVSITTPDGPQPADFTLNAGQTVVDVLTELGRRAGRPEPAERVERERLLRGLGPAHRDERQFQPEPAGGHRYQDHPYAQRRRGRGPLGPVHAYRRHGHAGGSGPATGRA